MYPILKNGLRKNTILGGDGINAISLLRKEYEEVRIIVLTMYDDQEMISKMMEMGANAYLTKTTDPEEI